MKNKGIVLFLIGMAVVIIGVIIFDFQSRRPDRKPANPYELSLDTILAVDPALILYKEVRNLKLAFEEPRGISRSGNVLAVVGDQKMITCDLNGKMLKEVNFSDRPKCVKATPTRYYIGMEKQVLELDSSGTTLSTWGDFHENTVITSIDVFQDKLYIADAGARVVYRLSATGVKELEFEGKAKEGDIHGFIIPSANFDLAFDPSGEFWVVNPGKHALENYTTEGSLRGWWDAMSNDIKGFTGCCNPANIAFLPDGNLVTSEKAIVRIKEYKPSGEFVGVVAAPSKFEGGELAPDIVTDEQGRVYALDKDRKMIRVFEKKLQ